jgi:hypothetical protein
MVGAVVVMLAAERASAAPPCSRDAVEEQVRVLGGSLDGARDRVRIEVARDRIEGSVTYVTAAGDVIGPRVVRAATCKELATSLALVIVMSLHADEPVVHDDEPIAHDDESVAHEPVAHEPAPHEPVAHDGEPAAPEDESAAQALVAHDEPRLDSAFDDERVAPLDVHAWPAPRMHTKHLAAFVGAASDAAGLPALVVGSRWRRDRLSLGLELHVAAPQSIAVGDAGSVRIAQTGVDVAPCVHAGALAVCGLANAGVIGGEGRQLAEAMAVYRPSFAVGARLELDVPIVARVSLRLHVDGLQALTSTRFSVDQMTVWTSDSRELWLGAGVLATFP